MIKGKPVILWTCDVEGWAYHNRIMRLKRAMPEYEFMIFYFGSRQPRSVKKQMLEMADVIVCQGVKAIRIVEQKPIHFVDGESLENTLDQRYDNLIARLDSVRIDFEGEYYDIWTGEKIDDD